MKAWISVETDAAGRQQFVGHASDSEAFEGRFELVGVRRGAGGSSNVSQGGSVRLAPGQTARLSQMSFGNITDAHQYSVHLRIFQNDRLVGSAELTN